MDWVALPAAAGERRDDDVPDPAGHGLALGPRRVWRNERGAVRKVAFWSVSDDRLPTCNALTPIRSLVTVKLSTSSSRQPPSNFQICVTFRAKSSLNNLEQRS